jgi:hypothetical protein
MIPARFAPVLFGLILSGLVSGVATYRALGLPPGFVMAWTGAWLLSWAVAFPTVLVIAPFTRRIVAALTKG